MRLGSITLLGVLALPLGCSSTAIDDPNAAAGDTANGGSATSGGNATSGGSSANGGDATSGGSSANGGSQSGVPSACSSALKQSLSLVDKVSTGAVAVLDETGAERTLYIDATAGGINGQDSNPWVYVSLKSGHAVALTDLDALDSTAWDLGFKRFIVRTNGGDSGPGQGGAIRVALAWDKVDASTLGKQMLPRESWFDADCNLKVDENMELVTTFSGWSMYDEATHVLNAADVVFITAGADGTLYKVGILDYYSTPAGTHGTVAGRYKVRVLPLQ
ncbi:MAG TPA: HmuY family protein [Polyangiaceae bacterium]|nr:HmuY family protein [Polyangiaceae bacterium]